ncbi:hypothetical protein DICPUDRAFT_33056 [Dictyostelium purpureum]|uniref:Protein kinase domain-containing protein n=1 Tax=Dictyostelium purpureum TaxID=5786 RepID=F0ZK66_DICPU|nr:uncharacterized protein DICPUDRAFT_33056 [Dictyostelium purpureum]EGC35678.1 hypothetical protein DICPUDRAFT_33056 [Dictyostelium purpureum]|eukprot:XP_003287811.1 hypothetical protein DICPUDRAFT_33056 [Dictyostelium purpureum]
MNNAPLLNQLNNEEKRQAIVDKETCGDYILIDIIGKGGFGVVYKGLHKTKGHFSAIKKIKIIKKKKQQNESQNSLMAEINLLRVLSHHNIVRYYEHIPSSSHSYIIMEFIENGSLEKIIKRHGLLPESLVTVYIAQVLNGLEYLHRQGVIHRDIKAANLLISTDGSIKLADFGVATKVSDLSSDNPDDSFAGTPYWMAPEVIQMQGISTACDVWSLGCTIIELLTGTPPYFGLAPAAALYKIVQEDHPPIPQGISTALKDFLLNCFKKDENMRSSAKQLLFHPWVKSIAQNIKITENQVKNARQEILSYNTQLQEINLDTRPRSSASNIPLPQASTSPSSLPPQLPSPINTTATTTTTTATINNNPSSTFTKSQPISVGNGSVSKPVAQQPQISSSPNSIWSAVPSSKLSNAANSIDRPLHKSSHPPGSVQIASPRKLSAGQKVAPQPVQQQTQQLLDKEKLNSHLLKFSEKESEDEFDIPAIPSNKNLRSGTLSPPPPLLQRQQSFNSNLATNNSNNNSNSNSNSNSINSSNSSKLKLPKFNKYMEKENEDDESDLIFDVKVSDTSRFKVRNQKKDWDDEFENFSSSDEEDSLSNASGSTAKSGVSSISKNLSSSTTNKTNLLNSSKNSNNINNNNMKLKVKVSDAEWDTEFEEAFDTMSWSDTDNQRTLNIQDKYREQVIKTIVDFLIQLNPNQTNDQLIDLCQKLTDVFTTYPEERRLLISNGEGGVYFRLPIITILEILEDKSNQIINDTTTTTTATATTINSIASAFSTLSSSSKLILGLLKLINQSIIKERDIQETICLMNGIPIITRLANRQFDELVREEVSRFVLQLCSSSTYSLNMFITGSRGCRVLVDLLDSDYFNGFSLIHNSLDAISLIFKMNTASPKTALCHLFAKTLLMYRIAFLLNQIFNPKEESNKAPSPPPPQPTITSTPASGVSPSTTARLNRSKSPSLTKSSSVKNLSKDQFDKVLSYSVKAADILLFFSTGDSLVKEEMSQANVIKFIVNVLEEIYTWRLIGSNIRSFLLRILKVIKNLSMDPNIRSRLDDAGVIPPMINFLKKHSGIEKITEIHNQALHSLYYLLLLDRNRQEKALKGGILEPLLNIIDERGPLKELALPILFDLVRTSNNRSILWQLDTFGKLLDLTEDRNWFADAIESISTWATLEPSLVFERLTASAESTNKLFNILNVNHIKHPSFQKSIIPLYNLINHKFKGAEILLKSLIKEGLVTHLLECLRIDNSPISKITLLKITVTVVSFSIEQNNNNSKTLVQSQIESLHTLLNQIVLQDESEIAKMIAENLILDLNKLK